MKIGFVLAIAVLSASVQARLVVFTTTTNLADVVRQVGGDAVKIESLCKGTQDPHYLEAKPSYTFKLSKADLLISVGAGLEEGWLPLVVRGSRNPRLRIGQAGRLVASSFVEVLEKSSRSVSRAEGDVHPEGNPHFMLSPLRSIDVAKAVRDKLKELKPSKSQLFDQNTKRYERRMMKSFSVWKKKVVVGTKVISYHKTLTYFYRDFGINNIDVLEPKPGIPPTASHILKIISKVKGMKINRIVVENYFDNAVARRVVREVKGVSVHTVPVAVNGEKGIDSLFKLYDHLVAKLAL